ncbi:MAG: WG repeat-containing protein [Elusimicrobia bacterium]|nr:WG repeat-containing protein [Elusimicrobiota bacterium]
MRASAALLALLLSAPAWGETAYGRWRGGMTGYGWLSAPPVHRAAELFPVLVDGIWGFIDARGRVAVEPRFSAVRPFVNGAAAVRVGRKWGVVMADGRMAVEPAYDDAGVISDGMLAVRSGELWAFLSTGQLGQAAKEDGRPPSAAARFEPMGDYHEGYAVAYVKRTEDGAPASHLALVSKSLAAWAPGVMEPVTEFSEGLACVRFREQGTSTPGVFIIDSSGRRLANLPEVLAARNFSGGRAPMHTKGGWGFVDRAGRWAVPPRFTDARPHSGGLAAVMLDGRWGFADAKGAMAVPARYSEVGDFSDGLASVCEGPDGPERRCGYIVPGGEAVIPLKYPAAFVFVRGLALVLEGREYKYIDKKGRVVYTPALYYHEVWDMK